MDNEQLEVEETLDEKEVTTKENKKKNKKVGKIILNTLTTLLVLVVGADVVVGVVNMQRINDKEEPIWYLHTKKTESELKTVTEYDLGLYRIVITDTAKETKTTLKPFFFKN